MQFNSIYITIKMIVSLTGKRSFFVKCKNARSIHVHPVFVRRHSVGLFEFLVKESDIPVTDLFADAFNRDVGVLQQNVANIGVIHLSVNIYIPV